MAVRVMAGRSFPPDKGGKGGCLFGDARKRGPDSRVSVIPALLLSFPHSFCHSRENGNPSPPLVPPEARASHAVRQPVVIWLVPLVPPEARASHARGTGMSPLLFPLVPPGGGGGGGGRATPGGQSQTATAGRRLLRCPSASWCERNGNVEHGTAFSHVPGR